MRYFQDQEKNKNYSTNWDTQLNTHYNITTVKPIRGGMIMQVRKIKRARKFGKK